jgi:hypothetical protein
MEGEMGVARLGAQHLTTRALDVLPHGEIVLAGPKVVSIELVVGHGVSWKSHLHLARAARLIESKHLREPSTTWPAMQGFSKNHTIEVRQHRSRKSLSLRGMSAHTDR